MTNKFGQVVLEVFLEPNRKSAIWLLLLL